MIKYYKFWQKNMKQIIFTTLFIFTISIATYGQNEKIVARPVEGSKPFIMKNEDFEKLEHPASLDRFGKIDDEQKKIHLQIYTNILSKQNKTIEYVIHLQGKTKEIIGKNMKFIYSYMTESQKIDVAKISFVIDIQDEENTELWLIPNKIYLFHCAKIVRLFKRKMKKS